MSLKTLLLILAVIFDQIQANIWDNLWSNNQASRVVFPSQFELKLSWNAAGAQKRVNSTNYVQGHIKIDQLTNRMMMDTNFSTLSLAPQELVSYILDFSEKMLYLKQKESCKKYDIIVSPPVPKQKEGSKVQKLEIETFPNIADLFELFPFVMFLNR